MMKNGIVDCGMQLVEEKMLWIDKGFKAKNLQVLLRAEVLNGTGDKGISVHAMVVSSVWT
jgi:hypothetical protein